MNTLSIHAIIFKAITTFLLLILFVGAKASVGKITMMLEEHLPIVGLMYCFLIYVIWLR